MKPDISVVIPCLNEELTIRSVVENALQGARKTGLTFEILVSDNGSTDNTLLILKELPVRVINAPEKGYGAAIRFGIAAAKGKFIVMADADDSYELENLEKFVTPLLTGFELVVGNRFQGGIQDGAMPHLHRYLGNPALSFIGRLFFKIKIGDFHCGIRSFTKSSALALNFKSNGMEFASEMIAKYALDGRSITEVPTILRKDGRQRRPHLRTWRDGWRHLKFLLVYSPAWLFLLPATVFFLVGASLSIYLLGGEVTLFGKSLNLLGSVLGSTMMLISFQFACLFILTKQLGSSLGLFPRQEIMNKKILKILGQPEFWLISLLLWSLLIALFLWPILGLWIRDELNPLNSELRTKIGLILGTGMTITILGVANSFVSELIKSKE